MVKAKEQKQKEVDELVARDLECKEAAETVKKLELELKEKEAKEKEQKEIEKELKKKEAVEAERDALQTNLADLNKTKDHLLKTIEKLRSEQKSVQDEIKLLDAPLENQVVETKAELQESIANEKMNLKDLKIKFEQLETSMSSKKASDNHFNAEIQRQRKEMLKPEKLEAKNSDLEKVTKEVDKLKQKRKGVDDAKVFEQNDEETNEVSEPNSTLIDALAVVDQDEKEVDSEPAAAAVAEAPIEIDEPVAETVKAVEEPVIENVDPVQESVVEDEPVAVVEEETVEASATEIEVKKEDPNLLIETSYACIIA